jgi:hypothetical protein
VQGAVLSRSAVTAKQQPHARHKPLMSAAESAATPQLVKLWDKKTIFGGALDSIRQKGLAATCVPLDWWNYSDLSGPPD